MILIGMSFNQLRPFLQEWMNQDTEYTFQITSESELTDDFVGEIAKLDGIQGFYPIQTCAATLKMKNYTLRTEVRGVDLNAYPLTYKELESSGVHLGKQPVLMVGEDLWKEFRDSYDHRALDGQIEKWKEDYGNLSLQVQLEPDEQEETALSGAWVERAAVGGILAGSSESGSVIYMDRQQLSAWIKRCSQPVRIKEGCVRIKGLHNVKAACQQLKDSGFEVSAWGKI